LQDHPFNTVVGDECWDGRLDKLIIWEPGASNKSSKTPSSAQSGGQCLSRNNNVNTLPGRATPVARVISTGESLNLELLVDAAHAASSYFKHSGPLFEAKYEFVHSPLCGPAVIPPSTEGELHFPHYEALGYTEPPRSIRCIWEIQVTTPEQNYKEILFLVEGCLIIPKTSVGGSINDVFGNFAAQ
jgi:hypothetical protein